MQPQIITTYRTVFVILDKTIPWQVRLVEPFFLVLGTAIAVGTIMRNRKRWLLVVVVYAVFLVMTLYISGGAAVQDMYERGKDAYRSGQYSIVEGTVTNFHPMPYSGHEKESFSVNGVQFSYSDFILVPCFNNTTSHGGPIHEGLRVRIAYAGDCILKLEVAASP